MGVFSNFGKHLMMNYKNKQAILIARALEYSYSKDIPIPIPIPKSKIWGVLWIPENRPGSVKYAVNELLYVSWNALKPVTLDQIVGQLLKW